MTGMPRVQAKTSTARTVAKHTIHQVLKNVTVGSLHLQEDLQAHTEVQMEDDLPEEEEETEEEAEIEVIKEVGNPPTTKNPQCGPRKEASGSRSS